MARSEFNLSVLENATAFSTPLKECSDYEAILSLIKEEIDIGATEDETESQKSSKNSPRGAKRKESVSRDSETVFKSPYKKKKYSLKVLSPGAQPAPERSKSLESPTNGSSDSRVRSLGRAKPGRSCSAARARRSVNSHSESSNFSPSDDSSKAEALEKTLSNGHGTAEVDKSRVSSGKVILDAEFADDGIAASSNKVKDESSCQETSDCPNIGAANESFVECSQTMSTSSELRIKLNNRRSAGENTWTTSERTDENGRNSSAIDEEDDEKFSLVLSPVRHKRKKSSGSPLNGLSQELESCIRNGEYIEMCDSETESMSFTFETIQLLNEYEDGNQQANNQIFDKILSSPAKQPKIEASPIFDDVASEIEQPTEDPLRIEEANADTDASSKKSTAPKRRSTRIPKGTTGECKIAKKDPPNEIKTRKKSPPSTSKRRESTKAKAKRKSTTKTPTREKQLSDKPNAGEIDSVVNDPPKSSKRKSKADSAAIGQIKMRSSGRLSCRTPVKSYFEDGDELEMKATELAENVAVAKKKAALPKEILDKLKNLVVRLRHKVPPQHEIENRAGSAPLSYEQQKEFLSYAPLNKGKYNAAEDEIIKENWNCFCEDHDWDPEDYKPFLLLKHDQKLIISSLKERRKFVQYLANGLPHRPLCSVYSRFRLIYNNYEALGLKYTKEEDEQIIAYMTCVSDKPPDRRCAELAKVINRSRTSIWKRYKKLMSNERPTYQRKRVITKVEWDLPLIEEFIATLMSVTLSDELIDLKDAFIPRVVWLKMEEKMQINWDILQRFWEHKLHMQLFAPEPIFMNEIRIKLIEYMHMNKIESCKEIKWSTVVNYFDGYTKPFLRYVFNLLTMQTAAMLQTREFSDILEWMYNRKISELTYKLWDKNLPRITYKDKRAELVHENVEQVGIKMEKSEAYSDEM